MLTTQTFSSCGNRTHGLGLRKQCRCKLRQSAVKPLDKDEAEMVPLGDILDRVSDLLGYSKPDAYNSDWIVVDSVGESYSSTAKKRKSENTMDESLIDKYKKKFEPNTGKKGSSGVKERNLAMARYYEKKAERTELEIQILKTQLNNKCHCIDYCKTNGNINSNRSDIINRINKLSSKINSEKLIITNNCGNVVNNDTKVNNINSSDTDHSDSSNDRFDSTNVDSKDTIVHVNIVKQETGSP
ncbi:jg16493 [Pararge aegeria aegeria]|uniref:Jg16493 protein n=1 Tax=Pararge aegeria aegeria TaxID=348720 RepID=A0A8S4R0B9_9NEOP|nr:jg16493 [Pararge aegeria aegeria]